MKRWIAWTLLISLLFSGCVGHDPDSDTTVVETTLPDPGIYIPESAQEQQTDGAVRAYAPGQDNIRGMDFMGGDVVLLYGDRAVRLTGENCSVAATGLFPEGTLPEGTACSARDGVLAYYNSADNSIVYYNDMLQETGRKPLPHSPSDMPILGEDLYNVYYCVGSDVYAVDLRSGIARMIRRYDAQKPQLCKSLFGDTMLLCLSQDHSGKLVHEFISTQTGAPLGTDATLNEIHSFGNNYILRRQDGIVEELLFGAQGGEQKLLTPKEQGRAYSAASMNGLVVAVEQENGVQLSFYDLQTGQCSAQVLLQDIGQLYALAADDNGSFLWVIGAKEQGEKTLYRWNVSKSATMDLTEYSSQRYTLENPDAEGMAECKQMAKDISNRYGVKITIAGDVKQPGAYCVVYEHQVSAIKQSLEQLDAVLAMFPEKYFWTVAKITDSRRIHIGIVRSIENHGGQGAGESYGLQYWVGGDAYIALVAGPTVQTAFLHEICHVMDSYVLSESVLYDEWSELNPVGFRYDENYTDYLSKEESDYLQDGSRSFIDAYSMTYAKEDRARIFEYAMQEGMEAYFKSPTLQNKLLRMCKAIRDAFRWEKDTRVFPWEQYLNKSIAYVDD